MKERPILFSGPMVRAILAGQKTMTRRVVKPQPNHRTFIAPTPYMGGEFSIHEGSDEPIDYIQCPYGTVGDRLWVRETWAPAKQGRLVAPQDATYACFKDGSQKWKLGDYFASNKIPENASWPTGWKWRPSIFMPRWASRITLEISGVRCERLQEISEEDAKAEGVESVSVSDVPRNSAWSARQDFAELWDKINGKRPGCDWASNPWCWVLAFSEVKGEA